MQNKWTVRAIVMVTAIILLGRGCGDGMGDDGRGYCMNY